jgi:hypothetical protein
MRNRHTIGCFAASAQQIQSGDAPNYGVKHTETIRTRGNETDRRVTWYNQVLREAEIWFGSTPNFGVKH